MSAPQSLDHDGQAAPSKLEVHDPLKPFTDIIDIFRTMAVTGSATPDPAAASLDLDALLRGPVLDPEPPTPPAAPPSSQPSRSDLPIAPSAAPMSTTTASELTDLQAIIDAASAAIAEIDGNRSPSAITPAPRALDPSALAALSTPPGATAVPAEAEEATADAEVGSAEADETPLPEQALEVTPPETSPTDATWTDTTPADPAGGRDADDAAIAGATATATVETAPTDETADDSTDDEAPRSLGLLPKLVGAAVVLALMTGTGWFLARGPLARTASTSIPAPTPAQSAPAQPIVQVAPKQDAYAAVLAAVTASTDLASLGAAADQATELGQEFTTLAGGTPKGQLLINAETAALQAFSSLDVLTPGNAASQFPALMATLQSAASAVAKARKDIPGSDPTTDTTPAITHVLRLIAPLALDGFTTQLNTFVRRAGEATKTADLRKVADDAFQLRVATEDTNAVLGGRGKSGARAALLQQAVATLVTLKTIDGDHLDQWSTTGPALKERLTALGQSVEPVTQVDQMISAASLVMKTWIELHSGVDKAALAAYKGKVDAAMKSWSTAWASVPTVTAEQAQSFAVTTRFYKASQALGRAADRLDDIALPDQAPDDLVAQHKALVALATRSRAAALAGHNVALAAEDCGEGCIFGTTKQWPAFQKALGAVGSASAVRTSWRAAYDAAAAEAIDATEAEADRPVV